MCQPEDFVHDYIKIFLLMLLWCGRTCLTLLVRVCVAGHYGTDCWEGDAGHGSNSSSGPHHP